MNKKFPIISMVIGGALIGGSLLFKYLTDRDEDDYIFEEDIEEDISVSLSGADSDDDSYISTYHEDKPSLDEILEEYSSEDDEIEEEDEEEQDNDEEEIDEALKEAGPFVISYDSFLNEYDSFSKNTLSYFEGDGVVADDRDEVIVDYLDYIGDYALDSFGVGSDDPNIVYVRNFSKEADYEVVKDSSSYQETVLGYNDPGDRARKYFNLDIKED